jgi:hypothetical protein
MDDTKLMGRSKEELRNEIKIVKVLDIRHVKEPYKA